MFGASIRTERDLGPPVLRIGRIAGPDLGPHIPALARLRQAVFRDWPYLYEGSAAHEQDYLRVYASSARAALIVAWDGAAPVGLATCLPLDDETPNVVTPFHAAGLDPAAWCYFGESVLLPPYRGQGAGVAFFQEREAHARSIGLLRAAFCAVVRPDDHPLRPAEARPLDGFWRNRGYQLRPGLTCTMRWPELGAMESTAHTMQFWTKDLGASCRSG